MYYNLFNIPPIFATFFDKYVQQGFNKMIVEFDFNHLTEDCRITLINKTVNRNICFRFQTYNGPNKNFIAEFVYFWIDNENEDHILFEHFWKLKKGKEYRIVSLINQVKGDTFEERLKNYFDIVKDMLENDLKSVVEGKEWIDLKYGPRDDYV